MALDDSLKGQFLARESVRIKHAIGGPLARASKDAAAMSPDLDHKHPYSRLLSFAVLFFLLDANQIPSD
jgi:hypothetical protein